MLYGASVRTNIPAALRALRSQRGWRQDDLGRRAGLSRDAVSRAESGQLHGLTLRSLSRMVEALDATLLVEARWQGADLDRLVDRAHAAMQDAAAHRLSEAGWLARPEVSFNHFGDRGRCDLVGWHASTRTLLVVEVKSRIGNLQETLGRLDVKVRLGGVISQQLGWGRPARVVRALVLGDDRTTRRVLARHESLFRSFGLRGRSTAAWLRAPVSGPIGLIWFERTNSDEGRITSANRVRMGRSAG